MGKSNFDAEALQRQHGAIRREFAEQAVHWGADEIDDDLRWAVNLLPLEPDFEVLDVAAGSGLLGRAIAPRVKQVTAVDLTPEMLAEGRQGAARERIANILFEEGAAEDLPYSAARFDLVVTRFSLHHFHHPETALREMARVCRPGGHLAVIDIVSPQDRQLAERYNRFERLRDPSHTRALDSAELETLIQDCGFRIARNAARDVANDVEPWLDRSRTPEGARREILDALTAELSGGEMSGMRPIVEGGRLQFLHRWNVVLGERVTA